MYECDLVQAFQNREYLPFHKSRNTYPYTTTSAWSSRFFLFLMPPLLPFRQNTPDPQAVGPAGYLVVGMVCGEPFTFPHPIAPMTEGCWLGLMGQNGLNWLLEGSNPWPISLALCFDQLSCKAREPHWPGIGHPVAQMPYAEMQLTWKGRYKVQEMDAIWPKNLEGLRV